MTKNLNLLLILILVLMGSYFFILNNHFLGDDINRLVQTLELNSLYAALSGTLADRPLLQTLMWLEKKIFGLDPISFRVINLISQGLASFQLYLLLIEIQKYRGQVLTQESQMWAWVVTFLFALHPLHGQSLYIVIQGAVVLAGLFGIWSLRYYFKWFYLNERYSLLKCFMGLFIAMLFKPIVSFLPFFFIFTFLVCRKDDHRNVKVLLPNFLVLLIPLIYFLGFKVNQQSESHNVLSYFLIQTEVVLTYLKLIILPIDLRYHYDFNPPANIFLNLNWLYLFLHVGFLVGVWKLVKDRFYRIMIFGIYFSFLPESSFFPIEHVAFEHRTYFALFFVFTIVGIIGQDYKIWEKRLCRPISALLLISYIVFIQVRNFQIKPDTTWFFHTLENSQNYDDFNIPGVMLLLEKKKFDEAKIIIAQYKASGKQTAPYKMLYEMANFYFTKKNEYLKNVAHSLTMQELSMKQRLVGNNFLIMNIAGKSKDINALLAMEDMLFNQMVYFKKDKAIFRGPLNFYFIVSEKILSNPEASLERILRIKAVHAVYFNKNYDNLKLQIESALSLNPTSRFLQEAKSLFVSSDKK